MPDPSGRLPSVTTVLGPWADFSRIPEKVLAHAAARGTKVHNACSAIALGVYPLGLDAEAKGYVDSFRDWFKLAVSEVAHCEGWLADEAMGFGGIPDLICRVHGDKRLTLIDLKTPRTKNRLWSAQLAAYKHLAEKAGFDIGRTCSLRLNPDGKTPIFDEYSPDETGADLAGFLAALTAYRAFGKLAA